MHDIRRLGLQVFAAPNNLTGEVQIEVKAREIDFVTSFGKNLKALLDILGITRMIRKENNSVLKTKTVKGELQSGDVGEDLYKTVARNCFRYFGFTSFKQVDQLTLAEYELMMEALELRMLDESLHEHRQAFLNFAVKAEKKAGKGKTKPVYKRFRQFFDFDKELKKMKNRRKPSRFAGITKLLDREE